MKEKLKQKRQLAYLLNEWDDKNLPHTYNYNNITEQIIKFFKYGSELIYPAKSYFVAIVYAKCLEKYFDIDFYESLNDKELLPDDCYFTIYNDSKDIYDNVIENIGDIWQYKSINKTVNYFKKEFLINEKSLCNPNI